MTVPKSLRVRALTLFGGVLLGALAVLGLPAGAAQAHAALISTSPAQNAVVPAAPGEVVITFSEAVHPQADHIFVIDPQGKRIGSGAPRAVGDALHIPVRTDVPSGTFLVSYRVISADGHPVGGGYSYSVGAPSPGGAPKLINGGATDPVVATGVSVMQFIGFVGLVLVLGPAMVLIALWPRRLDRRQPIRLAYTGLGLIGAATVLGLYLQAPYGSGAGLFTVSGADISYVMDSQFGRAYLVRLAVLVVLGFLLRPVLAGKGAKADFWLLGILGAVGLATWPLAGHPGATTVAPLTVVADLAHLTSVGIWLGGLVMLAVFLLRRANARELGAILPVWSNWAMLAVSVLVLSGTAQALIEIGTVHALVSTTYGRLVLIKVALLVVILVFAQQARKIVTRHAGVAEAAVEPLVEARAATAAGTYAGRRAGANHDDAGDGEDDREDRDGEDDAADSATTPRRGLDAGILRRLRVSVLAEVALAVGVLVATSILVQAPPARNAAEAAALDADSQGLVTLNSKIYSLQVDASTTNGLTELHLYAQDLSGVPLAVQQWTVVATLPSQDLTQDVSVVKITDSHAIADVSLPPGAWTFSFTLRITDLQEATVSTVIPIS